MTLSAELSFPKLNHFWLDSGLLGLVMMLKKAECNVELDINDTGLTIKGSGDELQQALERAYDQLIDGYYNKSTKKQKEDTLSYNFYYDSSKDAFFRFPKKKSVGIAGLIFNKAPRPTGSSVKWVKKEKKEIVVNEKAKKVNRGLLPSSHAHLQQRMDEFLDIHGLDVTTSGLLLDGPNAVRPKVTIAAKKPSNIKGTCFLCGQENAFLESAGQTVFPFITGSSGLLNFNALCGSPEKVCWKCAYVGKFAPVNCFYLSQGDNLFSFFPCSTSFQKMVDIYPLLEDAKYEDPNLFNNFKHSLGFENFEGGYFQKPFEVSFAFLYTIYKKVLLHQQGDKEDELLNWEKMLDLTTSKAPLEFVVLHAESKGQTSMGKMVWPFRDSIYFFRLIKKLEEAGLKMKEVVRLLIDFSQKNENKTILRNRVCERILKKQSALGLIERHVYSIDQSYIKPLFDFIVQYEPIIRKEECCMNMDEQEAAVILGKRIGVIVGKNEKGKKGDLFALRKARRKSDFLNELNRLQFKCSLTVPPDIYEGKLTDTNFMEFKQFCMIAALNSFHAATKPKDGGKT